MDEARLLRRLVEITRREHHPGLLSETLAEFGASTPELLARTFTGILPAGNSVSGDLHRLISVFRGDRGWRGTAVSRIAQDLLREEGTPFHLSLAEWTADVLDDVLAGQAAATDQTRPQTRSGRDLARDRAIVDVCPRG